jgi:hypothetical protein
MRSHGKLAVLKDDEVDRLERASKATTGLSRQEVMDSMYGRVEPKPKEPVYTAEEKMAMQRREEDELAAGRRLALLPQTYLALDIPRDMGMDCGTYKWRQSQSHVEIYVPLPEGLASRKVVVLLSTARITIEFDERPILKGSLYREIKAEESTWYIQDGVLEVVMLKRCRRGHYESGTTNADTFWRSILRVAAPGEALPLEQAPTAYYWAPYEESDAVQEPVRKLRSAEQALLPLHHEASLSA